MFIQYHGCFFSPKARMNSLPAKTRHILWLDMEMTGLDVARDRILEVAVVLTDMNLENITLGPSLVIYQPEDILQAMGSWCKKHHSESGLLDRVRESTVSIAAAEGMILSFLKEYGVDMPFLGGNTVYQDRLFLSQYMRSLVECLHYRQIDVSSVKELVLAWYSDNKHATFSKKKGHRAQDDIIESIEELKHYRRYFFTQ